MSFATVQPCHPRLNRSQLAVPGSSLRFIEKARSIPADIIMFDLEDAVALDEKEQARRNVVEAIQDLDWGERTLSVRINGLDTTIMYRDLIEVVTTVSTSSCCRKPAPPGTFIRSTCC